MPALRFDYSALLFTGDEDQGAFQQPRLYVYLGDVGLLALIDTAAEWSVVTPQAARAAGVDLTDTMRIRLATRFGSLPGSLVPGVGFDLVCEGNTHYQVHATAFVPDEDVDLPVVLGWRTLLDKIPIALTPEGPSEPARLYLADPDVPLLVSEVLRR